MIPLAPLLALACGGDAVERAMEPPRTQPAQALDACGELDFEQMQVLCRIEVAAQAGSEGLPELAERACSLVPVGTWTHECHFRVGEELASSGHPALAVEHCARSGRFARFCITHAAWSLPLEPQLDSRQPVDQLIPALDATIGEVALAVGKLEAQLQPEALDSFRMGLWFNVYYGTGHAHPAAARAAGTDQLPQARTAYLIEAARLLWPAGQAVPTDAVAQLLDHWAGSHPALEDAPLPADERHGRYSVPLPVPCERELQPVPLYGGGRRILGSDADEDLLIAALEALFFRNDVTAAHFVPWLDDPRERVRWSAARLLRLSEPGGLDMAATLEALRDHSDSCVAWHARDALQHRSWERAPGRPR